jgi:hypothetical protein
MRMLIVLLCVQTAMAQPAGAFAKTGSMTTARYTLSATLLNDGRVLVAGGFGPGFDAQASAELYDPASGTFSATGSMTAARARHRAVLLPDGRVLIAGGQTNIFGLFRETAPAGADVFDPSTGAFTRIAGLDLPVHSITLLPNGQVLIIEIALGGGYLPANPIVGARLYEPSTGGISLAAGQIPDRLGEPVLLPNGKVLLGGEIYDPATHTFSPGHAGIEYYTSSLLIDGSILYVITDDFSTRAFLYDPSTGVSRIAGTLSEPAGSATRLADGGVLLVGFAAISSYDSVAGTFTDVGTSGTARFPTATLLKNGQVLMTGGFTTPEGEPPGPPLPAVPTAQVYAPTVLPPPIVLLSLSGDGRGQGAIQHGGTAQVATADHPAAAGEIVAIYWTGLLEKSVIPPQVAIGGHSAEVLFFGNTPGYPGLNQINVRVPRAIVPGSAVPVRLTYLGRPSNDVTIGVQ